jgi:hypothetical protein
LIEKSGSQLFFGTIKPKGITRIVKIGHGHLREENLTFIITY